MSTPTALIILDGFGYRTDTEYNAIAHAQTPHITAWMQHYPHTLLHASGTAVGLPHNTMGNSEVGHLTIGSGRIIQQPIARINNMISTKKFFTDDMLCAKLYALKYTNKTVHLIGLLSDGSVHSHEHHLYAFAQTALRCGVKHIVVHPFLDGRDTPPQSAAIYLQRLTDFLSHIGCGSIGSLHGRFYAMDRDNNWDRTQASYQVLTYRQQSAGTPWQKILEHYYTQGITDEFIPPTQLNSDAIIREDDGIIFFNVRPDRARQLTACFVDPTFNHFPVKHMRLAFFITPVSYGNNLHTDALLPFPKINNTLKEILTRAGKTIFSIAETEKYAHVTYFFDGGKETKYTHETRVLIPSLHTKNYVENPHMSAQQITDAVIQSLTTDPKDFYLINYANADMVAHSGNFNATVSAIEYLDGQLERLYEHIVKKMHGTMYITADHGNAEDMYNSLNQQPKTSHTTCPVPFIMLAKPVKDSHFQLPLKELCDIAPFIAQQMGLSVPDEMKKH